MTDKFHGFHVDCNFCKSCALLKGECTPEVNYTCHVTIAQEPTYTILKPISIKALEEAGACERELHRFVYLYAQFQNKCESGIFFDREINIECVIEFAKQCNGGIQFLLDNGFIEEKVVRPDLKVDDKVLVRNSDDMCWERRHFMKWDKGGLIRCFGDGKTSYTTNCG